jgi:predicted RNA methylase
MLDAAGVRPGETVYDLGCGDGRVLITAVEKYRAKAIGVELSPLLARQAAEQIRQRKLEADAKVIEGNMLDVDLSGADVVVLYLLTESNNILKPRLEKFLKPGARVVSHDFEVRGWKPARIESVDAHRRKHKIYVYEVGRK